MNNILLLVGVALGLLAGAAGALFLERRRALGARSAPEPVQRSSGQSSQRFTGGTPVALALSGFCRFCAHPLAPWLLLACLLAAVFKSAPVRHAQSFLSFLLIVLLLAPLARELGVPSRAARLGSLCRSALQGWEVLVSLPMASFPVGGSFLSSVASPLPSPPPLSAALAASAESSTCTVPLLAPTSLSKPVVLVASPLAPSPETCTSVLTLSFKPTSPASPPNAGLPTLPTPLPLSDGAGTSRDGLLSQAIDAGSAANSQSPTSPASPPDAGLPTLPTPLPLSDGAGIPRDGLLSQAIDAGSAADSQSPTSYTSSVTFKWINDGDSCDDHGDWFWSQDALDLAYKDGYLLEGDWLYAFGRNGSLDCEFWVEYPVTWHLYGFVEDEVFSKDLLVPLLRPPGPTSDIATQCILDEHLSLSSIRFESESDTFDVWPDLSRWDSPFFSKAVTAARAHGKFSLGSTTRSRRSIGISVSVSDFCDPYANPLPPSFAGAHFLRGDDAYDTVDYEYDPYDKSP